MRRPVARAGCRHGPGRPVIANESGQIVSLELPSALNGLSPTPWSPWASYWPPLYSSSAMPRPYLGASCPDSVYLVRFSTSFVRNSLRFLRLPLSLEWLFSCT